MSSKDTDEEHIMPSKRDNVGVMSCDKANEIIEELFKSLLSSLELGLETQIRSRILTLIVLIYFITNATK